MKWLLKVLCTLIMAPVWFLQGYIEGWREAGPLFGKCRLCNERGTIARNYFAHPQLRRVLLTALSEEENYQNLLICESCKKEALKTSSEKVVKAEDAVADTHIKVAQHYRKRR